MWSPGHLSCGCTLVAADAAANEPGEDFRLGDREVAVQRHVRPVWAEPVAPIRSGPPEGGEAAAFDAGRRAAAFTEPAGVDPLAVGRPRPAVRSAMHCSTAYPESANSHLSRAGASCSTVRAGTLLGFEDHGCAERMRTIRSGCPPPLPERYRPAVSRSRQAGCFVHSTRASASLKDRSLLVAGT